jgi:hypothetical protein
MGNGKWKILRRFNVPLNRAGWKIRPSHTSLSQLLAVLLDCEIRYIPAFTFSTF